MSASTRMLARQLRAEALAHLGDVVAEDDGVGPREVDVLEDAARLARRSEFDARRERAAAARRTRCTTISPARDLAHRLRADQIERARLRRDDERVVEPAEDQRAEAVRIARGVDAAGREQRRSSTRLCTCESASTSARSRSGCLRSRDQMHDHFGVRHGVEDRAFGFELPPHARRR